MMSGPFIFIATNRLREGKLAAERERARDLSSFIEANEPQLLAFNEYANEEGTEVGVVQMHPDAPSMELHMEVVAERAARAYAETLDATTSIQVYGEPSDAVLEMLSRQAGAGVPMMVKRHHIGGFSRIR
jgi:NAD-dependent oxidoreductase involved in siderophore biosynthesis